MRNYLQVSTFVTEGEGLSSLVTGQWEEVDRHIAGGGNELLQALTSQDAGEKW